MWREIWSYKIEKYPHHISIVYEQEIPNFWVLSPYIWIWISLFLEKKCKAYCLIISFAFCSLLKYVYFSVIRNINSTQLKSCLFLTFIVHFYILHKYTTFVGKDDIQLCGFFKNHIHYIWERHPTYYQGKRLSKISANFSWN